MRRIIRNLSRSEPRKMSAAANALNESKLEAKRADKKEGEIKKKAEGRSSGPVTRGTGLFINSAA